MNYDKLEEIIVRSQEELDAIPTNYKGRIYIEFGTAWNKAIVKKRYYRSVVARENSSVEARENSSVEARENSSVVAWENSSVVARENSSVVARENSSVVARENSSVVAWENSSVVARENSSVVAWENSSVVARENSSVVAWENSSVVAWENSSVVARENSSVEARENSSVVAWENSSVVARENSSVVARENSSVVAQGNTQVVDRLDKYNYSIGKILISGNARKVYMPKNINEFMDFYGIKHTKTKATFYKAVRKYEDGTYHADWKRDFTYELGKTKTEQCDTNTKENCGCGIHIAHLNWALNFGRNWSDLAIIEVETKIENIVMPEDTDGKVRTSKVKVLREVPLEECGAYGKILARRRQTNG